MARANHIFLKNGSRDLGPGMGGQIRLKGLRKLRRKISALRWIVSVDAVQEVRETARRANRNYERRHRPDERRPRGKPVIGRGLRMN